MTTRVKTLVVGIGSPHGDDQAGWMLIEKLLTLRLHGVDLRKATVPHQLLDWTSDCRALHVVDACHQGSDLQRIEVRDMISLERVNQLSPDKSTHDLGVATVIDLGRTLRVLPSEIVVWAIPGSAFEPSQHVSAPCRNQIDQCAERIASELESRSECDDAFAKDPTIGTNKSSA